MRKYNGDQIHHRIMLEFPDGSRRWGYASTMSAMSSHSMPVIACGDDVYKPGDIALANIDIICNNSDVCEILRKHGYIPISRKESGVVSKTFTLPRPIWEKIETESKKEMTTVSKIVVKILEDHYGK